MVAVWSFAAVLSLAVLGFTTVVSKKKRAMMIAGDIVPTKKPDFDNIQKIICDALNGVAYHDDSQIVKADIEKVYSTMPHVEVNVAAWAKEENDGKEIQ